MTRLKSYIQLMLQQQYLGNWLNNSLRHVRDWKLNKIKQNRHKYITRQSLVPHFKLCVHMELVFPI